MRKVYLFVCALLLAGFVSHASVGHADTTVILIANAEVQIETTQAMNDLYNFKFDHAEGQFKWLRHKYPWHPLPYFLLGLSAWWKIVPNTKVTRYDKTFIAYMDTAIFVARNLHKKAPAYRVEAAFFLAAAHGFKGRLYAEGARQQWMKAASESRQALRYLESIKGQQQLSPELLFGDALYNYFSAWIPEHYSSLKPFLWFFPKGDKKLGMSQLKEVSYNAFYTRTEAMVWLMKILYGYENKPDKALPIAEYLFETYPDNPYLHRYYVRVLYANGRFTEAESQALELIHRIDSGYVGYEANSGRYAAYYLARMHKVRNDMVGAKKYYALMVAYAGDVGDKTSWYYLTSLLRLGDICQRQGNRRAALSYFTRVKKEAKRNTEAFREARKKMRKIKRK